MTQQKSDRRVGPHCNIHNAQTDLQILNTKRWHQQGQLKRLAALIDKTLINYPNFSNIDVLKFINLLEDECNAIQKEYEDNKLKLKAVKK